MTRERTDWAGILGRAAEIVESYETSVTLRQLFYRLVSELLIPNIVSAYKQLSARSAAARRDGWFPRLIDPGRSIDRYYPLFNEPATAQEWLRGIYRRDRTEGQAQAVYLGVEKSGMVEQLRAWFGDPLGLPILALGGYSSQGYVDEILDDVARDPRPTVLIYAGDLDSSGEDIDRDFVKRAACWDTVVRIGLALDHVEQFGLPPLPGKTFTEESRAVLLGKASVGDYSDPRSRAFSAKYGSVFQVELDALPPEELRHLFANEIDRWWDDAVYAVSLERERSDIERLPSPEDTR